MRLAIFLQRVGGFFILICVLLLVSMAIVSMAMFPNITPSARRAFYLIMVVCVILLPLGGLLSNRGKEMQTNEDLRATELIRLIHYTIANSEAPQSQ